MELRSVRSCLLSTQPGIDVQDEMCLQYGSRAHNPQRHDAESPQSTEHALVQSYPNQTPERSLQMRRASSRDFPSRGVPAESLTEKRRSADVPCSSDMLTLPLQQRLVTVGGPQPQQTVRQRGHALLQAQNVPERRLAAPTPSHDNALSHCGRPNIMR